MPSKTWSELLQDAEAGGSSFNPIPAGEYDLVISKSEYKKSAKGKDMFAIQAKVIDGPSKGRIVFNYFTISPESPPALGIFFRQMKILGLGPDYFAGNPENVATANALVGKVFRGTVGIEPDNKGEDRNVLSNIATASEAAKQAALNIPTSVNSSPSATPSTTPTPTVAASAPPAPPAPAVSEASEAPAAPPAPPATGGSTLPPPPPAPSF